MKDKELIALPVESYLGSTALRFVKRDVDGKQLRVLQQLFTLSDRSEWRDVPLVEEAL